MIWFSAFREDDDPTDDKPGPISMRRVLSFFSFIAACVATYLSIVNNKQDNIYGFVPTIAFLSFSLLLLIGTTVEDITKISSNISGKKE